MREEVFTQKSQSQVVLTHERSDRSSTKKPTGHRDDSRRGYGRSELFVLLMKNRLMREVYQACFRITSPTEEEVSEHNSRSRGEKWKNPCMPRKVTLSNETDDRKGLAKH